MVILKCSSTKRVINRSSRQQHTTPERQQTVADLSTRWLVSFMAISLIRVPGHRSRIDNCIADDLARQGTIMPLLPKKENVGMPMATCTHWQNAPQCHITRHGLWYKNLGTTQRMWHASSSSHRPLARWHTYRQAKSPKKLLLYKQQGWRSRGNGRTPFLLLPSLMQTQTLRKPLHQRSYRNTGD